MKVTVQVREADTPNIGKATSGYPYPDAPKCNPCNQLRLFESYSHLMTFSLCLNFQNNLPTQMVHPSQRKPLCIPRDPTFLVLNLKMPMLVYIHHSSWIWLTSCDLEEETPVRTGETLVCMDYGEFLQRPLGSQLVHFSWWPTALGSASSTQSSPDDVILVSPMRKLTLGGQCLCHGYLVSAIIGSWNPSLWPQLQCTPLLWFCGNTSGVL